MFYMVLEYVAGGELFDRIVAKVVWRSYRLLEIMYRLSRCLLHASSLALSVTRMATSATPVTTAKRRDAPTGASRRSHLSSCDAACASCITGLASGTTASPSPLSHSASQPNGCARTDRRHGSSSSSSSSSSPPRKDVLFGEGGARHGARAARRARLPPQPRACAPRPEGETRHARRASRKRALDARHSSLALLSSTRLVTHSSFTRDSRVTHA